MISSPEKGMTTGREIAVAYEMREPMDVGNSITTYRTSSLRQRGWFSAGRTADKWPKLLGSSAQYQDSRRPRHRQKPNLSRPIVAIENRLGIWCAVHKKRIQKVLYYLHRWIGLRAREVTRRPCCDPRRRPCCCQSCWTARGCPE